MAGYIFGGNTGETPESLKRRREAIEAMIMGQRTPQNWGEGWGAVMKGIAAGVERGRIDKAERAGQESASAAFNPILEAFNSRMGAGGFPAAPNPGNSTTMATMPATDTASARVAQAHGGGFDGDLRSGIISTAEAIGADPLDLATAISYETAGTFDPTKKGPRTQWGQHRGLIQFGEPQAKQHGVDWNDPVGSQLGPDGAIASYFRSSGFKPGMSGLDLYSTINAGAPGRYSASDANNGGAPGNVRDKWENQMAGHRRKAQQLLGDMAPAQPQVESGLTPDALQQWAFANYGQQPQNGSAVDAVNALGNAQPVGVAENEADILAQEQAMAGQAFAPQPAGSPAPPMPAPQAVQEQPVAPMQMGDASGGFPEMAGQNPQALPVSQAPDMRMLLEAANNPWLSDQQRSVVNMLLQQQMQAQDPMRQMQLEKGLLEIDALRTGAPGVNSSFGNLDAQARAAGLHPGTSEYQSFMLNGGGAPATFRALDMQAQAAGFQPGTPEYNEFMATRGAGLQAGAAQTAKNEADIATGGAAAGAKEGGKKTMEAGFNAWGDYGKLQTSIGNMDEAIAAIDGGAKSGIIYKMLPNITEASASLQNAMDRMGLDVIGSVTFGALSEGEMRLAMQTAAPRDLSPPELRNWLVRKRDAQVKAADMLADAAQYLTKPGNTINGWIERNQAGGRSGRGLPEQQQIPNGWEDEWEYLTQEERAKILGR